MIMKSKRYNNHVNGCSTYVLFCVCKDDYTISIHNVHTAYKVLQLNNISLYA